MEDKKLVNFVSICSIRGIADSAKAVVGAFGSSEFHLDGFKGVFSMDTFGFCAPHYVKAAATLDKDRAIIKALVAQG